MKTKRVVLRTLAVALVMIMVLSDLARMIQVNAAQEQVANGDAILDLFNNADMVGFTLNEGSEINSAGDIRSDKEPVYISELRMSTNNKDADSAKNWLRNQGYMVYNVNLNEGTDEGYVYLGYKTTTNKANAITDISLMDMEGGFSRMNYRVSAEASTKNINELATDLYSMCSEYRENYGKGSLTAILAYQSLNTFYVPGSKTLLGDYFLDQKRTKRDLYDMVLMCNSAILSNIYSYLMLGVQAPVNQYKVDKNFQLLEKVEQKSGATVKSWVEELEESLATGEDLSDRPDLYDVKATKILPSVREFSQKFKDAVKAKQENRIKQPETDTAEIKEELSGEIDEMLTEKPLEIQIGDEAQLLYYACYEMLEKFPNVRNLFLKGGELTGIDLYDMVKVLTPGQYNAVHMSSLLSMIPNAFMDEVSYNKAIEKLANLEKEIEYDADFNGKKMSVYTGVNVSAYEDEVGVTDEAYRFMSSKGDYEAITHEVTDHIRKTLNLAMSISGLLCGAVMLTSIALPIASFVSTWVGATAFASTCGALATTLGASMAFSCLNIATFAVAIILALAYLATYIYDWYKDNHPTYTTIPKKMFDIKSTVTIEYDAILDQTDKPGDLNNRKGRKWNALYTTKNPNAGSPLMLSEQGIPFISKTGDGTTPQKFEPITFFGEKVAVNMNRNAYDDDVGGIYLFYLVDGPLSSDIAQKEGKYLSDVYLFCEDTEAKAKFAAEKKEGNWSIYNYNLTQGLSYATYIGYQTSDAESLALRDIRVLSSTNEKGYTWGDQSYSNNGHSGAKTAGTYDPIAAGEYTLIATSNPSAGPPILAGIMVTPNPRSVPAGYEPINTLGGGGFFDFNTQEGEDIASWNTNAYVYFLPSKIYTAENSKTEYLGGFYFIYDDLLMANAYYSSSLERYSGRLFVNNSKNGDPTAYSQHTDTGKGKRGGETAHIKMFSTKTYNPYRAIGDIRTYKSDAGANMPKTMYSIGEAYTACEIYLQEQRYAYGDVCTRSVYAENNYTPTTEGVSMALYVAGANSVNKPIPVSSFSWQHYGQTMANHAPVNSLGDRYSMFAENLYPNSDKSLYLFLGRESPPKPKYIESLSLNYTEYDDYASDYSKLNLIAAGCDEIIDYNLNDEDDIEDRAGYLGITHINDAVKDNADVAIRGIAMYYFEADEDTDILDAVDKLEKISPGTKENILPSKIIKNNIQYTRVPGNGVYVGYDRWVFLYTTTAELAGEPITNIWFDDDPYVAGQSISHGTESAPILSKLADGYWFIHYTRTAQPKYISSIQIGVKTTKNTYYKQGYNWFWGVASIDYDKYAKIDLLQKGMTSHEILDVAAGTDNYTTSVYADDMDIEHVFFGHTRTSIPRKGITGIIAHPDDTVKIVKNGITYTRLDGECNTHYAFGGRHLVIYTTRDPRAGSPIVDLAIGSYYQNMGATWNYLSYSWGGVCNLRYEAEDGKPKYLMYRRVDNTADRTLNTASVFFNASIPVVVGLATVLSVSGIGAVIYKKRRARKADRTNKK